MCFNTLKLRPDAIRLFSDNLKRSSKTGRVHNVHVSHAGLPLCLKRTFKRENPSLLFLRELRASSFQAICTHDKDEDEIPH